MFDFFSGIKKRLAALEAKVESLFTFANNVGKAPEAVAKDVEAEVTKVIDEVKTDAS